MKTSSTDFGVCTDFVDQLEEFHLLPPEWVPQIKAYRLACPQRGPRELAEFLVEQQVLTKFQTELIFADRGWELTLSEYVLVDRLGEGSVGKVYRARST